MGISVASRSSAERIAGVKRSSELSAQGIIHAAEALRDEVGQLQFGEPVAWVYNPLDYAWPAHREYLKRFGAGPKRVVFLGMNPGPFGMTQTGVPFGEIPAIRDWMGITAEIRKPAVECPKRQIEGFACQRSEVSGRRVWGLMAERFGAAENFFWEHFVVNYCPLVFMEEGGRNRTPDKLPAREKEPLFAACDRHLLRSLQTLNPEWCIGIGGFAKACLERVVGEDSGYKLGTILHPSPASPAANRGWAEAATKQLENLGVW